MENHILILTITLTSMSAKLALEITKILLGSITLAITSMLILNILGKTYVSLILWLKSLNKTQAKDNKHQNTIF